MYQNTKYSSTLQTAAIGLIFYVACASILLAANAGRELAQSTLDQALAIATHYSGASNVQQRDNALQALRKQTSDQLSHLTQADRVDYVEYMADEVAKGGGIDGDSATDRSEAAFALMSAGPSLEELAAGNSRLLSSNDPKVRQIGEGSLKIDDGVKLPNGETGQNISVFNLALHDSKVPQDQLIEALFKIAPIESAQWFADHTNLPSNEKTELESDLQQAWKMHQALNDPSADSQTKAMLKSSTRNPLLERWLNSPSWIMRLLASGLLQKHQGWQTPDLKKAMQPVQIPAGLQITPGQ